MNERNKELAEAYENMEKAAVCIMRTGRVFDISRLNCEISRLLGVAQDHLRGDGLICENCKNFCRCGVDGFCSIQRRSEVARDDAACPEFEETE